MDEVVEALEKYQGLVPLVYDIETMSLDEARSEEMQYAVYLKREADKVIAELEESHKKEVGQLLIKIAELKAQKAQAEDDCAYWKMCEGNAVNAMHETEEACMYLTKSERHHKYKRCLAMAKWCDAERDIFNLTPKVTKVEFFARWHKRWLEIATKFKEAK